MASTPTWSIVARNLPEHESNPIHTDAGARAAGFERALVAGVTSYAYGCHPVIDRLGLDWVGGGEAEVRFLAPVFDQDRLSFALGERPDGGLDVEATSERGTGALFAVVAWPARRSEYAARPGDELSSFTLCLEGEFGSGYAARAGDDQSDCAAAGFVHPAVWPSLANSVFHSQLARGPWVHTRSVVRHFGLVPSGVEAEVSSTVVRRFVRRGERVVADVVVRVDGGVVAVVEHEAIIELAAEATAGSR